MTGNENTEIVNSDIVEELYEFSSSNDLSHSVEGWEHIATVLSCIAQYSVRYTMVLRAPNGTLWGCTYGLAAHSKWVHELPWKDDDVVVLVRMEEFTETSYRAVRS